MGLKEITHQIGSEIKKYSRDAVTPTLASLTGISVARKDWKKAGFLGIATGLSFARDFYRADSEEEQQFDKGKVFGEAAKTSAETIRRLRSTDSPFYESLDGEHRLTLDNMSDLIKIIGNSPEETLGKAETILRKARTEKLSIEDAELLRMIRIAPALYPELMLAIYYEDPDNIFDELLNVTAKFEEDYQKEHMQVSDESQYTPNSSGAYFFMPGDGIIH
jgi:arsenate reductase-like glutaredoxin family protein